MSAHSTEPARLEFGVLGTAGIADKAVVPAIAASDHAVGAVASRDADRAASFAARHSIPRSYGTYEALLDDDAIDAVYVPLPNGLHGEWTKRAADAGLAVLCEKPLAADAAEARAVADHCDRRGVTLMEAFMYRYHPRTERAVELAATELDDVRTVTATFRFPLSDRPNDVRLDPELAGGSLMDVGCYPVSLARTVLGAPDRAYAHTGDTRDAGVDTELAGVLAYGDGRSARVASGFDTRHVERYRVDATNGWVAVENAFDAPADERLELEYEIDGRRGVETFPAVDQYRLQVEHFADRVAGDATPVTDGASAVANMRILDALSESAANGSPIDL
ncbi:Gfo/Idh/MocA family oxidoreductase [Halorubrum ezzemoulense]|jgi:predicted dehydrogenase|uniref:Glucose-fructose oxidoreductase n=2 Tax=Halorubrum ezzemoulense TaxID=337243 RepID=A0A256IT64_HALEZ|nr:MULTISPECIES: Gfo/Idh/MocA family oxidoreductase [Halorubrum]MDB2262590.1 Gfo/Idh/MocA family oxidoreductase [Halorubrum ezzemoulense]MDB2283062.1 Gfo/Idh/MocA family oxidoreductase [Halorubrum ezzemoulense]MDB9250498.1 Gfo/Idh/MocA family oxidoreductase [Halorubrum ezzemoulense]MDB9253403.1 Gfo/Idh/MocA family oxidoreductase [Halorubrum ezzemoulense]MDB9254279.1 Gfo/Idh/MocA family oxidoreductase [Halorubrum ezzemoulense]